MDTITGLNMSQEKRYRKHSLFVRRATAAALLTAVICACLFAVLPFMSSHTFEAAAATGGYTVTDTGSEGADPEEPFLEDDMFDDDTKGAIAEKINNSNWLTVAHNCMSLNWRDQILYGSLPTAVMEVLEIVGYLFLYVVSFAHLITAAQHSEVSMDMWLRFFLVFMVGVMCVGNAGKILEAADGVGEYIYDKVYGLVYAGSAVTDLSPPGTSGSSYTVTDMIADLEEIQGYLSKVEAGKDAVPPANLGQYSFIQTAFEAMIYKNSLKAITSDNGKALATLSFTVLGLNVPGYTLKDRIMDGLDNIKYWAVYIIVSLALLFMSLLLKFQLFALIIELTVRRAFVPIAIADIATEGLRSSGMNYIKAYIACWIRVPVAYLVITAGILLLNGMNSVMSVSGTGFFVYVGTFLAVSLAMNSMIKKSGDLAKSIMGTN